MFNFVMGIVMIGIGAISVAHAFFSKKMAGIIFFGILMIGFGKVELVRSRGVKARKQAARDREFDMYNLIASEMGVKINPLTGEMLSSDKKGEDEPVTVTEADDAADVAELELRIKRHGGFQIPPCRLFFHAGYFVYL